MTGNELITALMNLDDEDRAKTVWAEGCCYQQATGIKIHPEDGDFSAMLLIESAP